MLLQGVLRRYLLLGAAPVSWLSPTVTRFSRLKSTSCIGECTDISVKLIQIGGTVILKHFRKL